MINIIVIFPRVQGIRDWTLATPCLHKCLSCCVNRRRRIRRSPEGRGNGNAMCR